MGETFQGYERPDGTIGIRNKVAIIPSVGCANEVAEEIEQLIPKTIALPHDQGCLTPPKDLERIRNTLIGLGRNPNVAASLIVSLGCESVDPEEIADEIAKSGKPVEVVGIQDIGGSIDAISKGAKIASRMVEEASENRRKEFDAENLVISTKCGASDTTSGISSNLAVGEVADKIVDLGGSFIQGEYCDIMGGEQALADRAVNEEIGNKIIDMIKEFSETGECMGADVVGDQLTGGNIEGGLTTVIEKAHGANAKGGSSPIQGFIEYGERIQEKEKKGVHIIRTPGHGFENLTGCAAAGAQVMLFTTGLGAPEGHPIMPTIKLCGNTETVERLEQHIDVDVSGIIEGTETIEEAGERLFDETLKVASGKITRAEALKYNKSMEILIRGPVI